jgi:hypothetical protein
VFCESGAFKGHFVIITLMSEFHPYTFMDELYAIEDAKTLEQKTKLLKAYCDLVIEAAEAGKNSWQQAAYEITATYRFDLDEVPGFDELLDLSGELEMFEPSKEGVRLLKEHVNKIGKA